ncbi:MAG TPA: 3',5'-cyclic-nucleotide phosphodiesterase [Gammaproteobacteria bacterium]|nr:3',5'-cyclic-nucleotide phosphodiesterase [Gammaproteobacteria bacterium]
MEIRVLGCSGGIGAGLRTTCLRVDDDVLVDAGTGLGDLPLEEMGCIRHIFLTHSHLDHLSGIPLMADSIFDRVREPITVYGRPETLDALRRHVFNWVIWPDFTALPDAERPVLRYREMAPGDVVELEGRKVEMIEVNHSVPGAGYRVESPTGGAFAFSGDTTTNDTFWAALNRHERLDLLIVESAFADADLELCRKSRHYCPSLLADDLAKLEHRPQLYLTHLKPGAEKRIFARCRELMSDLDVARLFGGESFRL